jgi:hypothetical protein
VSEEEFQKVLNSLLKQSPKRLNATFRELFDVIHTFRGAIMRVISDDKIMDELRGIELEVGTLDKWLQQGLEDYTDLCVKYPKLQKMMEQ